MPRKAAWDDDTPQFWCSSGDFVRMLRQDHPELLVPEGAIVYAGEGRPNWAPERELGHAPGEDCDHRSEISPGSLLCCPRCHLSGHERRLDSQRRLSGYPPQEPPKARPQKAPRAARIAPPTTRRAKWWARFATERTPEGTAPAGRKSGTPQTPPAS